MIFNRLFLDFYKIPQTTIKRTETISYPRSGHGALRNILSWYFRNNFNYCAPLPIGNCGCGKVPCTNPVTNYSKNHDFGLYESDGIDIQVGQQYLTQYRNPVRSIVSNYYLYLRHSPDKNSLEGWYEFARHEIVYWNKLIDKWVVDFPNDADTRMICPYEQLILDPMTTVSQVITFMTNDGADPDRLRRAIAQVNIRPLNRYVDFRFFDKGFFREIESLAGPRLEILAIPFFADSL